MLTSTIDKRVTRARSALIQHQPFFGTLALYLIVEERPDVLTMATDGTHLFYAPKFLDTITPDELKGVVVHEVFHCALKHPLRRKGRDPERWNIACDYALNLDVIAAGFKLPKGALLDQRYKGMCAEEIYALLPNPPQQPQGGQCSQQGQGQGQGGAGQQGQAGQQPGQPGQGQNPSAGSNTGNPSQGQAGQRAGNPNQTGQNPASGLPNAAGTGTGNGPTPCPWGQVLDAPEASSPGKTGEAEAEWGRRVRQALNVAAAHNEGRVPGFLEELVKETGKPKIDWREQLQRFINSRNRFTHSWSRPNRRMLSLGYHTPGQVPDGMNKLGIVVDTSLSIDTELLTQFIAELKAAMDEGAAEEVVIVHCDTQVQKVERFSQGEEISIVPVGRGGTMFSPALKWFEENEPDVAALIYFTDLICSDYGPEPGMPLLWAGYGLEPTLSRFASKVPFGEVIKVVRT